MNELEELKNGYVCLYKGKRMEVYAYSSYEAQQKAAITFKARHSYDVSVFLAERVGVSVIHSTSEI